MPLPRSPRSPRRAPRSPRRSPSPPRPRAPAGRPLTTCARRREIGRGVAGVVYETCCGRACAFATKVFLSARDFQAASREIRLQMSAAKAGLAPRVLDSGCARGECSVLMERVRMTLADYLRTNGLSPSQQRAIIALLEKLARLGIDHGDVHAGNIAVDSSGSGSGSGSNSGSGAKFRLRMIDFSEARKSSRVDVHAQVGKLVGDLAVLFPRRRFVELEDYAARGLPKARGCDDEGTFLRYVRAHTALDVAKYEDELLDIWMDMDSTVDCQAVLRRVARKFNMQLPGRH